MRHLPSRWLMLIAMLACLVGPGVLSARTIHLPAESFTSADGSWKLLADVHPGGWYTEKPLGSMIQGDPSKPGQAVAQAEVDKAGTYHLWIHRLTVRNYRGPVEVTVSQGDRQAASLTLDREAPANVRSFAQFVWDHLTAELEPGPVTITLRHADPHLKQGLTRTVNFVVLSDEITQQPRLEQFVKPLYMQVRVGAGQPEPGVVHVWGRRPFSPPSWYVGHHNIGRRGMTAGPTAGMAREDKMAAGDQSPWVDIAPIVAWRQTNKILFNMLRQYREGDIDQSQFELLFSTTPSQEGLVKRLSRSGPGSGMLVTLDLTRLDEIRSELEWSADARRAAEALPATPGRVPRRFPTITGIAVDPASSMAQTIQNEAAVMRALGINTTWYHRAAALGDMPMAIHGSGIFHMLEQGDQTQPRTQAIEAAMAKAVEDLRKAGYADRTVYLSLMDEPEATSIEKLAASESGRAGFVEYLKKQGLSPADVGASSWDEIRPTLERDHPLLYVQSVHYRSQVEADFFAIGTRAAQRHLPTLRTTSNFSNELSYNGNLLTRGSDWFAIHRQKALTYGWTEDWLNTTTSYQFTGLLCDLMRSATWPAGQPFGMYKVWRNNWQNQALAAAAIARGAEAIYYFDYGPAYAISSDPRATHDTFASVRRINYAIGAIEDDLLAARLAPSRTAMLYSHSTDIWELDRTFSATGKERNHLWLLARHLNEPVDFLIESDVAAGKLKDHRALIVAESNLTTAAGEAIVQWVRQGGLLILSGPGAMQFDELNRPAPWLDRMGIQASAYSRPASPGRDAYELHTHKPVAKVKVDDGELAAILARQSLTGDHANTLARYDDDTPAAVDVPFGQGHVMTAGFYLGLAYGHGARTALHAKRDGLHQTQAGGPPLEALPAQARALLGRMLESLGPPAVQTDHPLVQADLHRGEKADVLILTNWTGQPMAAVTVTLRDGVEAYRHAQGTLAGELSPVRKDGLFVLTLPLGPFEFVTLRR